MESKLKMVRTLGRHQDQRRAMLSKIASQPIRVPSGADSMDLHRWHRRLGALQYLTEDQYDQVISDVEKVQEAEQRRPKSQNQKTVAGMGADRNRRRII